MTEGSAAVLNRGMRCLTKGLGVLDAERFVSLLIRERFDYTKWHSTMFGDMTGDELLAATVEYEQRNPPRFEVRET